MRLVHARLALLAASLTGLACPRSVHACGSSEEPEYYFSFGTPIPGEANVAVPRDTPIVLALNAYASGQVTTDRSGAYYYGPQDAQGRALAAPVQTEQYRFNRGVQGEPYVDRPYGAPDNW